MSAPVRVARLDELPPGKGKVVQLGARDIAVFNLEGRYYASCAHRPHIGASELPGHATANACTSPGGGHGLFFDATAADSPARGIGEPSYEVVADGDYLVLYIEDAAAD